MPDPVRDFEVDVNAPTELYDSIQSENWQEAISILKRSPVEAKIWVANYDDQKQKKSFLPLHSACASSPPDDLVKALLNTYPDAASIHDDYGMLPIHYAAGNMASEDVINTLISGYPSGTSTADSLMGMLPLHYLCDYGPSSISIIDRLLSANPDAINFKDFSGKTPLDLARVAGYDGREEVIKSLRHGTENSLMISHSFESHASGQDSSNMSRGMQLSAKSKQLIASLNIGRGNEKVSDASSRKNEASESYLEPPILKSYSFESSTTKKKRDSNLKDMNSVLDRTDELLEKYNSGQLRVINTDSSTSRQIDSGLRETSRHMHNSTKLDHNIYDYNSTPKVSKPQVSRDENINLMMGMLNPLAKDKNQLEEITKSKVQAQKISREYMSSNKQSQDKLLALLDQLSEKSFNLEKELNEEKKINGERLLEMSLSLERLKHQVELQGLQLDEKKKNIDELTEEITKNQEELIDANAAKTKFESELKTTKVKLEEYESQAIKTKEEMSKMERFIKTLIRYNKEEGDEIRKFVAGRDKEKRAN